MGGHIDWIVQKLAEKCYIFQGRRHTRTHMLPQIYLLAFPPLIQNTSPPPPKNAQRFPLQKNLKRGKEKGKEREEDSSNKNHP